MIDTLKVELNGFEVREDHGLTIQPAAVVPRTGEQVGCFRLWPGMEARSAYHNADKFQFDIQHRFGRPRATVKLSLPGYSGMDNVNAIGKDEAKAVMKDLQRELDEIGIACNLEDALLSRVDVFQNVKASEPFTTYAPVLQLLDGKRMRDKVQFGGTSFRWGNDAAQINVYDKIEEMQARKQDVSEYRGTHLIRFEHRALDHRKIRALYGLENVMDFIHEYDAIPETYRKVMKADLFRYDGNDIEVLSERQLEDELQFFKEHAGRRWMAAYWEAAGLRYTLQRASAETVAKVIEKVSGDRNKAWRNKEKLRTALVRQKMLTKSETATRTYKMLYSELREGVLRAA